MTACWREPTWSSPGRAASTARVSRERCSPGIAKRTKPRHIPLLALVGGIAEDADAGYDLGVTAMFSIDRSAQDFREYASRSAVYYPADPGGHPAADKSGTTTRLCGDDLLVCPHNATNQ